MSRELHLENSNVLDDRWLHGMDGWRVRLCPGWALPGLPAEAEGEVTSYEHHGHIVWVVFDGEEDPRWVGWHAVRPA